MTISWTNLPPLFIRNSYNFIIFSKLQKLIFNLQPKNKFIWLNVVFIHSSIFEGIEVYCYRTWAPGVGEKGLGCEGLVKTYVKYHKPNIIRNYKITNKVHQLHQKLVSYCKMVEVFKYIQKTKMKIKEGRMFVAFNMGMS